MNVYKLKNTFEYEGEAYEEINLDFDSMTGEDILKVENELGLLGQTVFLPENDKQFQAYLAAHASKLSAELIKALPCTDFNAVCAIERKLILKKSEFRNTLTFDFDSLTGNDIIEVERLTKQNGGFTQAEFSIEYQINLAAKATGKKVVELKKLPINDFSSITRVARNFLLMNSAPVED